MASPTKPKWRKLAPEMAQMSAEKAIVLALHHLELARSMFDCIEPARPAKYEGVDEDIPDEWKEANDIRRRFAMAALAKRYPGEGVFNAAAAAFINSLADSQDASDREYFERTDNLPVDFEILEGGNNGSETPKN